MNLEVKVILKKHLFPQKSQQKQVKICFLKISLLESLYDEQKVFKESNTS